MGEKMSNAPVYYALAQVQFNPVEAMAKYVTEIQDNLRKRGYTLFEPQKVTHMQFVGTQGDNAVEPQVEHTQSWLITKSDRTAGFILTPSSLTFHTTHYVTSSEFIPELLNGLNIVHGVVDLEHISRLGLRYLDAVIPGQNETVEQHIYSALHGLNFAAKRNYSMIESTFDTQCGPLTKYGKLIARVYISTSRLAWPPDLAPKGLVLMPKFDIDKAISHAVIDTDHFVEGQFPLDPGKIEAQLDSLHTVIKEAFNSTITEYAKNAWS